MNNQTEMRMDELDTASGGKITLVAEKGYVGLEVSVGGFGFAVWVTGGSVCGSLTYPGHKGGTCVPA